MHLRCCMSIELVNRAESIAGMAEAGSCLLAFLCLYVCVCVCVCVCRALIEPSYGRQAAACSPSNVSVADIRCCMSIELVNQANKSRHLLAGQLPVKVLI